MVAALEDHDRGLRGRDARQGRREQVRLGARVAETHQLDRGEALAHRRSEALLVEVRRTEGDSVVERVANRLRHDRMRVAEEAGGVLAEKVDVLVTVGVGQPRALAAHDRERERLDVDDGAGVPAGHHLRTLVVQAVRLGISLDVAALRCGDELRLQRVVCARLDDHARRGRAALARGAERRPEDPLDRELEIGVVEDDGRVLATELEVDVLEVVGCVAHHLHPGLARAGQRDHAHVRVADEPVTDRAATAVDDVHDPVRQPRLDEQLDEALAEERRVGRRLEHDGVAAHECGQHLPRGNGDREVPRRDRADDTDRHPHAHVELVAQLGRRRLAEQAAALSGHVVRHVDRFLNVAAGLGLHLPHLVRHQVGEVVLLLDQQLAEAEQNFAALRSGNKPPFFERRLRRGDGAVDVLGPGLRKDADRLAVRGADALEGIAVRGVHPITVDVVLEPLRPRQGHGGECS